MILINALNILRLAFLNIGLSTQINQRSMVLRVADAQYVLFGEWGRGEITISALLPDCSILASDVFDAE